VAPPTSPSLHLPSRARLRPAAGSCKWRLLAAPAMPTVPPGLRPPNAALTKRKLRSSSRRQGAQARRRPRTAQYPLGLHLARFRRPDRFDRPAAGASRQVCANHRARTKQLCPADPAGRRCRAHALARPGVETEDPAGCESGNGGIGRPVRAAPVFATITVKRPPEATSPALPKTEMPQPVKTAAALVATQTPPAMRAAPEKIAPETVLPEPTPVPTRDVPPGTITVAPLPTSNTKPSPKLAARVELPMPPLRTAALPPHQPTVPSKREYGIDIGGATSIALPRARWREVKARFGPQVAGFHSLIAHDRYGGHLSYWLVIGQLPTSAGDLVFRAAAAAQRASSATRSRNAKLRRSPPSPEREP